MLVKCFFRLVLLVRGLFHVFGRFVGWFWFEKICSTSPPRGNQVDGLPRASSWGAKVKTFCGEKIDSYIFQI